MSGTSSISEFEEKKTKFYDYYDKNKSSFDDARTSIEKLVSLLVNSKGIEGVKVISRVKERSECVQKFNRKYRTKLEESGSDYEIKDHISDVIGIRIICLHEGDMQNVVDIIRNEFKILKEENKSKDLIKDFKFGYKGLHIDAIIDDKRNKLPEYLNFSNFSVEMQIRSIVQDAWSEVDHKIKYKKQVPDDIKRRIIRLAALFELADQEFGEIRRLTKEYEARTVSEVSSGGSASSASDGDVIDSVSFLNFINGYYMGYGFESHKVDGFVDEIIEMNPAFTLGDLRQCFNVQYGPTQKFRIDKRKEGVNINPFTHMRHMLYLHDETVFKDMLYPNQRQGFRDWVAENEGR